MLTKTHDPVLCAEKSMLTKTHDPVLCTEKSVPESLKETLHGSSETGRLFIDLASTNVDVEDMRYKSENVHVIEDIPIFTGEDSKPECLFPTFYIHNANECLYEWT